MLAQTSRTPTNTGPKPSSSLCRRLRGGVTSSPEQSCQRSERTSKAPWTPSRRTIQACEMSYNKCMPRILPTTVSQSPKFKSDDKTEYFYYHFHSCRTPAGRHALVDLDE